MRINLTISYIVRSSKEINWNYQRNAVFLDDYYRKNEPFVSKSAKFVIFEQLRNEIGISLHKLTENTKGKATKDDIFFLIILDEIYVDLTASPLVEADSVIVFLDKTYAQTYSNIIHFPSDKSSQISNTIEISIGTELNWNGRVWHIANMGRDYISLLDDAANCSEIQLKVFEKLVENKSIQGVPKAQSQSMSSEAKNRLLAASPKDLAEANRKHKILQAHLNDIELTGKTPSRTLRLWKSKYLNAKKDFGYGYIGLIPIPRHGNKIRRLSHKTIQEMDEFISSKYETFKQMRKFEVYSLFYSHCEEVGIEPASYKTFTKAVKKRSGYKQTLKRKGKRRVSEILCN